MSFWNTFVGKIISFPYRLLKGDKAKKIAEASVKVVDRIKAAINSPAIARFVEFVPGDVDDKLLETLRKIVPDLAIKIAAANTLLQTTGTPEQIVAAYVNYVKGLAPQLKVEQYQKLSTTIIVSLSDGKISWEEAAKIAQDTYDTLKAAGIVKGTP